MERILLIVKKKKISFVQRSVTGYTNHTPEQAQHPEAVDQHKKNSMSFTVDFFFCFIRVCFDILIFVLLGFFICFDFLFLWALERTKCLLGKEVERIWEEFGEVGNMIKIYYTKKL